MCKEDFELKFDELAELYRTDPQAFEEKRKEMLEDNLVKICGDCPEKLARCRAMQWRIDQELSRYKNPVAKYNKMVEMFWKQFSEFQVSLNTLQGEIESEKLEPKKAEIIQFNNSNK